LEFNQSEERKSISSLMDFALIGQIPEYSQDKMCCVGNNYKTQFYIQSKQKIK